MATRAHTPAARTRTVVALRRLEAGLRRAGEALLLASMVVLVVFFPAGLAVKAAQWSFSTELLAVEVGVATVLMALTVAGLWWAFTGHRLAEALHFGRFEPILQTTMVALFSVATFASLTALLYREGAIALRGEPIPEPILFDRMSERYVWQLADSVPLLDIPANLEWEAPFEFADRIGGLLVIVFTGIVILPLIAALRLIVSGHRAPYGAAALAALRKAGWKVERLHERGSGRAVAAKGEARVLVDLMQDVWNEDAPLRRLRALPALQPGGSLTGCVLAAGAVGERARDRIEAALERSEVPARLVVWKGDEPGALVAEAVAAVAARGAAGE